MESMAELDAMRKMFGELFEFVDRSISVDGIRNAIADGRNWTAGPEDITQVGPDAFNGSIEWKHDTLDIAVTIHKTWIGRDMKMIAAIGCSLVCDWRVPGWLADANDSMLARKTGYVSKPRTSMTAGPKPDGYGEWQ